MVFAQVARTLAIAGATTTEGSRSAPADRYEPRDTGRSDRLSSRDGRDRDQDRNGDDDEDGGNELTRGGGFRPEIATTGLLP